MKYRMTSQKRDPVKIMLIDELSKNMQIGKQTDLILLDLRKAFDKDAQEKLLLKLHHYGIRGDSLK